MVYLAAASSPVNLAQTTLARGIFTPFAHPMFSALCAVGFVLSRKKNRPAYLLLGLLGAVLIHFAYDAALLSSSSSSSARGTHELGFMVLFVATFASYLIGVIIAATRASRASAAALPVVARWLGMPEPVPTVFASRVATWQYRRTQPRAQRRRFDDLCDTLSSIVNRQPSDPDLVRLAAQAHGDYQTWVGSTT